MDHGFYVIIVKSCWKTEKHTTQRSGDIISVVEAVYEETFSQKWGTDEDERIGIRKILSNPERAGLRYS